MIAPQRHHITLEVRTSDLDRVGDIAADALGAARRALRWCSLLEGCPPNWSDAIDTLREIVDTRAVLDDGQLEWLRAFLRAVQDLAQGNPNSDSYFGPLIEALGNCVSAAERAGDLLAAERHVRTLRGRG